MKGFVNEGRFRLPVDEYVAEWVDDPWYPVISKLHADLKALVPCYGIAQIKEKFGGLRYYVELPITTPADVSAKTYKLIDEAEKECYRLDQYRY